MTQWEVNDEPIQPRRRRVSIVVGVLAATLAGLALFWLQDRLSSRAISVARSEVRIEEATSGLFRPALRAEGTVVSSDITVIAALEGGVVTRIERAVGDRVSRGELIAEISNPGLIREIDSAVAQITGQLADIVASDAQITNQIASARASVRDAAFRLAEVERDLYRQESLHVAGFASEGAVQRLRAQRDYMAQVLEDARANERDVIADADRRRGQLRSAREGLQVILSRHQARAEMLRIVAPADGRLTRLDLQVGQSVAGGDSLGQVENDRSIAIMANFPARQVENVQAGASGVALIGPERMAIQVRTVAPSVVDGMLAVRLVFEASPPALRIGEPVQVEIYTGEGRIALHVPGGPLLEPGRAYVLSRDGEWAIRRRVTLGQRSGLLIELQDGVNPGDRIVVESSRDLSGYARLRLEE